MRFNSVLVPGMGALLLIGTDTFALSGTVKDNKGAAVAGALIHLASDTSVRASTNARGEFTVTKPVSTYDRWPGNEAGRDLARVGMRDDRIHLTLPGSADAGAMTLFASDGRILSEMPLGPFKAGDHQVNIPRLAPGFYYLRVDMAPFSAATYLVHTGKGTILAPDDRKASAGAPDTEALLRIAAAAGDTLLVKKAGFVPARFLIDSYDQTGIDIVMAPDSAGVSPLPPVSDYSAPGPFNTVVEANVGPNGAYTIFRPDPLGKDGFLHAPIIYGYGINGQIKYATDFLRSVASHGFVIIGCNILTGGPNSPANNTAMTNGLNWMLQQNSAAGSKFQGKLAVTRAATMGYSVGGTAAVDIGGHEAVKTVVSIHGHVSKAVLHGTLLQTTGTKDNVGLPMQQQTFANSKVPTFLGTVTGADHSYPGKDGGVQRPAIIAWLRYWIYNDTGAKRYFYGDDCVMCKAPWENPQRKNWQ
jgi:dienelactone hydrolase